MNKNLFLLIFVVCAVAFFLVIIKQAKAESGTGYNPETPDFPMPKAQPNPSNPSAKKPTDIKTVKSIEDYQNFFLEKNFTGIDGSSINVDGVWGKNTQNAYNLFLSAFSKKGLGAPVYNFADVILYRSVTPFSRIQSTNPFRKTF